MFSIPLCAWNGLRYFIVALPEPSILLFWVLIASVPDLCVLLTLFPHYKTMGYL